MSKKNDQQLAIVWRDPAELIPYPDNAKIHSQEQIGQLAELIAHYGWDQPIVVDEEGVILKGHGRLAAALLKQMEKVPVHVRKGLSESEKRALRIADNKVSEAPWDPEKLRSDFELLRADGFDMSLTAFADPQIEDLLAPKTSNDLHGEGAHKSVKERFDDYQNSGMRQVILVMTPAEFDTLMRQFADGQAFFGVETNVEVVQKLFEFHAANRR